MRRIVTGIAMLLLVGGLVGSIGCGGKTAATAALTTAQTAFDAVKDQAAKVLPAETQKLADALAAVKADIDQGKVQDALTAAKALPDQVKELADAAAKKKDELTASWNSVSADLPKAVADVQAKVDQLAKTKHLPAGLDAAKFASLKESFAGAKQSWTDAQAAFAAGNLADAMAKVGTIKQALAGAMTSLGMQVPAALQAS
jgi:hypothetical protein